MRSSRLPPAQSSTARGGSFPTSWSYIWRQGLANLYRPNNQTTLLMLGLGLRDLPAQHPLPDPDQPAVLHQKRRLRPKPQRRALRHPKRPAPRAELPRRRDGSTTVATGAHRHHARPQRQRPTRPRHTPRHHCQPPTTRQLGFAARVPRDLSRFPHRDRRDRRRHVAQPIRERHPLRLLGNRRRLLLGRWRWRLANL